MEVTRTRLKRWLDSEEFYNLCQLYRTTLPDDQEKVVTTFEMIKGKILAQIRGPR